MSTQRSLLSLGGVQASASKLNIMTSMTMTMKGRGTPKRKKRRLGQARINAIIEDDPSSIDLDLDNDPVAQVREPANTQSCGNYSHGMQLCELLNMHREVVAKGRATKANVFTDMNVDSSLEMYNVQISLVLSRSERLFGSKKTFGELNFPAKVKWPAIFTRFI
ncbi:hypothetical protein IFM89_014777 [Coptis chinensis]|uniref:Uncharacterized protein n=1 Tax=Coptis chinensis TaxID=261450 RepID=A0A835IKV6_9MAGN|nr:hypothetical protein IFM89_014777 [Coptis chinensis]